MLNQPKEPKQQVYITRKRKTLTLVFPRDLLPVSVAGLLSLIGFLSVTISKTVGSSLIKVLIY